MSTGPITTPRIVFAYKKTFASSGRNFTDTKQRVWIQGGVRNWSQKIQSKIPSSLYSRPSEIFACPYLSKVAHLSVFSLLILCIWNTLPHIFPWPYFWNQLRRHFFLWPLLSLRLELWPLMSAAMVPWACHHCGNPITRSINIVLHYIIRTAWSPLIKAVITFSEASCL